MRSAVSLIGNLLKFSSVRTRHTFPVMDCESGRYPSLDLWWGNVDNFLGTTKGTAPDIGSDRVCFGVCR